MSKGLRAEQAGPACSPDRLPLTRGALSPGSEEPSSLPCRVGPADCSPAPAPAPAVVPGRPTLRHSEWRKEA